MVNIAIDRGKKSAQINKLIQKNLSNQKAECLLPILAKEDETAFKVNVLIQAFISRHDVKSASLLADQRTIVQQIVRIANAFFQALVTFKRLNEALKMLELTHAIAYQIWMEYLSPFFGFVETPLGQGKAGGFTVALYAQDKSCSLIQRSTIIKFVSEYDQRKITSVDALMELRRDDLEGYIGKGTRSRS